MQLTTKGRVSVLGGVVLFAACGGSRPPPEAGESIGGIPDLTGTTVMVFPTQSVVGIAASPDPELAFALDDRAPGVDWLMPGRLRDVLAGSPGLRITLDGLAVGMFLRGEVRRVGDPLWGELRRLSALTDAEVALIPVQVRHVPGTEGAGGAVQILTALVHARSGRVYWTGVVEGEPGAARDPAALASAAQALARRFAPAGRG